MEKYNLVSLFGIPALMLFAWLLSTERKIINWRLIGWGVALQLTFGAFIFLVPVGREVFLSLNSLVIKVLSASAKGTEFVFGFLAIGPGKTGVYGEKSPGFCLAFQTLPAIIFFSALVSVFYYLRIIPFMIRGFSFVFTKLLGISGAEALCSASNIFVGIESSFTVKPYLREMTKSEFCSILAVGMATVASNVLALYVMFLEKSFPAIAGHLISASILSAPAALIMSKLLLPETENPVTLGKEVKPHYQPEPNLFTAIITGANSGAKLIVGIVALLLAIIGLVALLDMVLGGLTGITLHNTLAYIFYPFTLIIGVPVADADKVAAIIGERLILTEVTSYSDLATLLSKSTAEGGLQFQRSAVIATYALCGFAHIPSLAIFVGGITALVPERTTEITRLAPRALLAATLACLMTACIAGTFYSKTTILLN